jgi:hypothetical protein
MARSSIGSNRGSGDSQLTLLRISSLEECEALVIVLACFSIANPATFDAIPDLLGDKECLTLLIGCQCDQRKSPRVNAVSPREAIRLMKAIEALGYIECSSQDDFNMTAVFEACSDWRNLKPSSPVVKLAPPYQNVTFRYEKFIGEDHPVFAEFCRIFGPGLRNNLPGANGAQVLRALTRMFKRAPVQLKMEIKRSLIPTSFFRSQEMLVRYPAE